MLHLARWLALTTFFACLPDCWGQEKDEDKTVGDWSTELLTGTVVKVDKDLLTVQPRDQGKSAVTMSIIDSSRFAMFIIQREGEKVMLTQREATVKELHRGQKISVIYTIAAATEKPVLLSAVASPDGK